MFQSLTYFLSHFSFNDVVSTLTSTTHLLTAYIFFSAVTLLSSHNVSTIHCALWLTHFSVPVFSSIFQFSIVIQHTENWKHGSSHPSTDISPFLSTLCNSKFMCMLSRFSCVWLFETLWTVTHQVPLSMGFSRKNTGVGFHAFLQRIFWTKDQTPVSCISWISGKFFTEPPGKPQSLW